MQCFVCGSVDFIQVPVLQNELIIDWNLSETEVQYINRQQGLICRHCGNNLRANVLAKALNEELKFPGPLNSLQRHQCLDISILEINGCHNLTRYLETFPKHTLIEFPDYDIQNLALRSEQWDLVLHSDTLEHVANPVAALEECFRILKPDGKLLFTTPIIVDRTSRSRKELTPSYHGDYNLRDESLLVHSEFGVDIWTSVARVGFKNIKFTFIDFPAGIAITAWK